MSDEVQLIGVRVWRFEGQDFYPHAHDWYVSSEDGGLQIYQIHNGDAQFVVAEYAKDHFEKVAYDPLPIPQPDPPAVDPDLDDIIVYDEDDADEENVAKEVWDR